MKHPRSIRSALSSTPRRVSLVLMAIKAVRAVLSLTFMILVARAFGVGAERDAFVLASGWISIVGLILFGPINEILRSEFVSVAEREGVAAATDSVGQVFVASCIAGMGVVLLLFLVPDQWLALLVPGVSEQVRPLFLQSLRALAGAVLLSEVAILWSAYANSYRSFFGPDLLGLLASFGQVLLVAVFAHEWGIWSLILSAYFVSLLPAIALGVQHARRHGRRIFIPRWRAKRLKELLVLSSPFWFVYGVSQGSSMIERILISYSGMGSASQLDYARKFIDLPMGVFVAVAATAMSPLLALFYSKKDQQEFSRVTLQFVRLSVLLLGSLAAALFFGGAGLTSSLLMKDRFDASAAAGVSELLALFALGMPLAGIYSVMIQVDVARREISKAAYAGLTLALLQLSILALTFSSLGIKAFAVSWAGSHLLVLVTQLKRLKEVWSLTRSEILGTFFLAAFQMVCGYTFFRWLGFDPGVQFVAGCALIFLLSLLWTYFVGHEEDRKSLKKILKAFA